MKMIRDLSNRSMQLIREVIFLMFLFTFSAVANEELLHSSLVFKKGTPLVLKISYAGGVDNWDAGIGVSKQQLWLSNSAFLRVYNSDGKVVQPIKDKVVSISFDRLVTEPFDVQLDLSDLYDLTRVGDYQVHWGCAAVKDTRFNFSVID